MNAVIEFSEIAVFSFFQPEDHGKILNLLQKLEMARGSTVLEYNKPVNGLYILVEGEFTVSLPPDHTVIASIGRGGTVGEMSMIEENRLSSAHIKVHSDKAVILFCPKLELKNLIDTDERCAHAFYRGVATLLSSRLRHTNWALQEQIGTGVNLLKNILSEEKVSRHLAEAKDTVADTSHNIGFKLVSVVPILRKMKHDHPELSSDIGELENKIEEMFLANSQRFNKIDEQFNLILGQFENIKAVANGLRPVPPAASNIPSEPGDFSAL